MDYMKNSTRHKTIISIFILLALAALALRLAFFTTSIRHAPVTTDEAIEFLMLNTSPQANRTCWSCHNLTGSRWNHM